MNNNKLISDIKSLLVPKGELTKKQVALFLTPNTIEALDKAVKDLSAYSNGKVNRNILIEMAIQNLLDNVPAVINEYEVENNPNVTEDYDTIIVSSHFSGKEFIDTHNYWEYVKINDEKIPLIKHIAFYIGQPYSSIYYYADVKSFEKVIIDHQKKYRVHFDGHLKTLNHEIPLDKDLNAIYTRSMRYTTLEKLNKVKTYRELLQKEEC